MALRSAVGSLLLLALLLTLNACGTSGPASDTTSATIRGTVVDSSTGATIDSAIALYRGPNDSLMSDANGAFTMPDMPPGLYLFDVSGYGYHPHRHVSALVEPGDDVVDVNVPLLPKTLQIQCEGLEDVYHNDVQSYISDDSTAVRVRLIDVFAQGNEVRVQPVFVSNIPVPLFVPDNFGARGHFDIDLYDADGNELAFTYASGAPGNLETHRIYGRPDLFTIVPSQSQRLEPSVLTLTSPVDVGSVVYARMTYDFSLDDTLRTTPVSDFPELGLDSLQVPVYDTLRVDGSVIAADSLVIQRDTTIQRVIGLDTTVTRNGYTLYDTEQDSNAFVNAQEAIRVLYVPDSIKVRARLDSMFAAGIDTTSNEEYVDDGRPYYSVERTNAEQLRSVINDPYLVEVLQYGIPREPYPFSDLRLLPRSARDTLESYVSPPDIPRVRRERKFPLSMFRELPPLDERMPDSTLTRLILSDSLAADSLLPGFSDELIRLDSLVLAREQSRQDSIRQSYRDSLQSLRDTLTVPGAAPDSAMADPAMADSVMQDSVMQDGAEDSTMADTTEPPVVPDSVRNALRDTLDIPDGMDLDAEADPVLVDSTRRAAIRARADSVLADSVVSSQRWADSLRQRLVDLDVIRTDTVLVDTVWAVNHRTSLPEGLLYKVPDRFTVGDAEVIVYDSLYTQLRAVAATDTALLSEEDFLALIPERLGEPPTPIVTEFVQQIVLVPTGGYREKYLETWKAQQQTSLRSHYCQIYRYPLQTNWRSTAVREAQSADDQAESQ